MKNKDFYLKFHVKDFQTNYKLRECGAEAVGVYIFIMCLLFDTDYRGKYLMNHECLKEFEKILPKQNDEQINKQTPQQIKSICSCISPLLRIHLPFQDDVIERSLFLLLKNNILYLEGFNLCQKRMVHDAAVSKIRSKSGKSGINARKRNEKSFLHMQNSQQTGEQNGQQNDMQTGEQNGQQNDMQKSNYSYNYNNSNNKGIGNTEFIGGEQKKINKEEGAEIFVDHYIGNWELKTDIDDCLKYYLEREEFEKDRKDAEHIFVQRGANTEDKTIFIEKLKKWGMVFNNANRGKKPKRAMRGDDSWVQHLHNWLKMQDLINIKTDNNKTTFKKTAKNYTIPERKV